MTGAILVVLGVAVGLYGAYAASRHQAQGKAELTGRVKDKGNGAALRVQARPTPMHERSGPAPAPRPETAAKTGDGTAHAPKPTVMEAPKVAAMAQAPEPPERMVIYFARGSSHVSRRNRARLASLPAGEWKYEITIRCGDAQDRQEARRLCKKREKEIVSILREASIPKKRIEVYLSIPRDPTSDPKYGKARWRRAMIRARRVQ